MSDFNFRPEEYPKTIVLGRSSLLNQSLMCDNVDAPYRSVRRTDSPYCLFKEALPATAESIAAHGLQTVGHPELESVPFNFYFYAGYLLFWIFFYLDLVSPYTECRECSVVLHNLDAISETLSHFIALRGDGNHWHHPAANPLENEVIGRWKDHMGLLARADTYLIENNIRNVWAASERVAFHTQYGLGGHPYWGLNSRTSEYGRFRDYMGPVHYHFSVNPFHYKMFEMLVFNMYARYLVGKRNAHKLGVMVRTNTISSFYNSLFVNSSPHFTNNKFVMSIKGYV
jgi:hypothetical protein